MSGDPSQASNCRRYNHDPMNFIRPDDSRFVSTSCEVPSQYSQYRLSGAIPLYVKGDFGDYLTQIIRTAGYDIQLNIFNILTEWWLHPNTLNSVIPLHFMLEGSIKCLLEGFGEAWLIEKCVNLFYVPGKIYHKAWFEPGFYRSFHIDFSPQTFRYLPARYPELNDVLTRLVGNSTSGVQQHTSYITPIVQKIVNEILHDCPVREPELSVFAEIKSKELLLKYVQNPPADAGNIQFTPKALIDQVTAFMETHLDYPFTIKLLAGMFTTNETALKRHFKQYTGQTIYTFLLEKRMEMAFNLLKDNTLPIRTIAQQVGYEDFSSFDRAFSHHFGHSPAFYRKR